MAHCAIWHISTGYRGAVASDADLRSRNVERNRAEAADIALQLFAERGYDAVGIDDIAAAAGISRRTFFRYFESKEGVVLPFEEERLEVLREALATRTDGETPLGAVRRAVHTMADHIDEHEHTAMLTRLRIIEQNPTVHARSLEVLARWEVALREVIAAAIGEQPDTSLTARVVASASVAAFRSAAELWAANGGGATLADLVEEAFEVLNAGIGFPDA